MNIGILFVWKYWHVIMTKLSFRMLAARSHRLSQWITMPRFNCHIQNRLFNQLDYQMKLAARVLWTKPDKYYIKTEFRIVSAEMHISFCGPWTNRVIVICVFATPIWFSSIFTLIAHYNITGFVVKDAHQEHVRCVSLLLVSDTHKRK